MKSVKRKIVGSNNDLNSQKIIKTEHIVEQDFINYISIPSLESIAIVSVATGLCKQSDIRDSIRKHSLEFDPVEGSVSEIRGTAHDRSFNQLEKNILNKLSLLPLPSLLKVKVANILGPIEFQILECIRDLRKDIEYMDSIFWTTEGTIDRVKTLEQLIDKDSGQYLKNIYESACTYCLEDRIPNLWDKLPENIKTDYLYSKRIYKKYDNHLIAYWTSIATNQLPKLLGKILLSDHEGIYNYNHSVYKNMFTLAVSYGYSLAAKYFWHKLTAEEISSNLSQWINELVHHMKNYQTSYQYTNRYADVLYFLLSKPNDSEQQSEIFQKNSHVILHSLFLDWPWQRFLLPTIQAMWKFLSEKVYVKLLSRIASEIKAGKTTEKLLNELWCDSPIHLKKCFIRYLVDHYSGGSDVLCNLLAIGDVGTTKKILNYANVEEQKTIIFSVTENRNLFDVIYADKLSLFNALIEETISSESYMDKLKENVVLRHGNALCHDWICANNWKMVETFFNWAFTSQDQIDYFKHKLIDKIRITYCLLKKGNYALVNEFLSWCCGSEQEINQFKKDFATSKYQIVYIGDPDFSSFEKFIAWCFVSEQEINEFKLNILQSHKMPEIIRSCIAFEYKFEFVNKLISWCCHSNEEIKLFKAGFVLSETWIEILQRFVSNYKIYDSEWNNWELVKKLIKLFSPLEEELRIQLKKKITSCVKFHDFYWDYKRRSYRIEKKHLFCLIDNDNYNIGEEESSSDDDRDSFNYDDEVAAEVLVEILNKVESGLL